MTARSGTRDRLLKVAKELFAARGYEHASTSAIARQAGTSESQLMKHFGSKAGLLEAIFADTWAKITADAKTAIQAASSPREKLAIASAVVVETMEGDPELKLLMLLEGRRIRREGQMIRLTHGFMSFVELLDTIFDEMKAVGQIRPTLSTQAIRSAFMGMIEGMMRDRFLAERLGYPANFDREQVTEMMTLMLTSWSVPLFVAASSTSVIQ